MTSHLNKRLDKLEGQAAPRKFMVVERAEGEEPKAFAARLDEANQLVGPNGFVIHIVRGDGAEGGAA